MNVHISYKTAKVPAVEKELQQQTKKLERRLKVFRPELVHLHVAIDQVGPREAVVVSADLRIPSGDIAAKATNPEALAAVKAAFDELLRQLTRHKEELRGPRVDARRVKEGSGQVPFEKTVAAVRLPGDHGGNVRQYVDANLPRLERFIRRELAYRINSGQIRGDAVAPDEVLDEVIARALGNGDEMPEKLTVERWLYRLAMRAMVELAARNGEQVPEVHLEESVRKQNVRASDEPELQYHQPDEMMLEETVIPDRRVATPEEVAASDEMIDQVELALFRAKPEDREAFILFAIEGFTVPEIMAVTDRSRDSVEKSIHAARDLLKKTVPGSDIFRNKLLEHTKSA